MRRFPFRHLLRLLLVLALAGVGVGSVIVQPPVGLKAADRVVIRYTTGTFQLLSKSPLEKVIPPADELPPTHRPVSGFWFELQSAEGAVKYRRFTDNPLRMHTESPDSPEDSRPSRAEVVPTECVFTVLLPRAATNDQLVLFSSPLTPEGTTQPAQVLARIPLVVPAN